MQLYNYVVTRKCGGDLCGRGGQQDSRSRWAQRAHDGSSESKVTTRQSEKRLGDLVRVYRLDLHLESLLLTIQSEPFL